MTTPVKHQPWLAHIAVKTIIGCMVYAWLVDGNKYAGNVFQFLIWLAAIFSLLLAMTEPTARSIPVGTKAQRVFGTFYFVALLAALAAFGEFAVAVGYLMISIFTAAHRSHYDSDGILKNSRGTV